MKSVATCSAIAIVIALLVQSLSLAFNNEVKPHVYNKLGSKIDYKIVKPYDIFSLTRAPVHARAVFARFWLHGFKSAVEPFRERPPKTSHPMSRRAWVSSPYYRAGLRFHDWGKKRASWEAVRYDRYVNLEFMSKTHPVYALAGYWLGRLFFFSIALAILLVLVLGVAVNRTIVCKIPDLKGARIHP